MPTRTAFGLVSAASLAIGVDELSVSPRAVLPLRNAVRMTDTRESAPRLLAAIDAEYPETL